MRPTCLICNDDFESEMAVGFSGPERYWICSKCLADARLGAMVRRLPNDFYLSRCDKDTQVNTGAIWAVGTPRRHGEFTGSIPEQALEKAGCGEA